LSQAQEVLADRRQGFVPGDALPAGVGVGLGAGALHRVEDAAGVRDLLRPGFALDAEAAVRVVAVRHDAEQLAVLDGREHTAARATLRAVGADRTDARGRTWFSRDNHFGTPS